MKKDFESFLADSEDEYQSPQQNYVKKDKMSEIFDANRAKLNDFSQDVLKFGLYRVEVEPPRVYVNSNSEYYDFIRDIGLPNISYLSVLKLQSENGEILYYFKTFVDYKSDIIG